MAFSVAPRRIYLGLGFGQGFIFSLWAVAAYVWWVAELELSPLRLVLIGTALEVTVLLSEVPTGVVADVFSRKWSVIASWVVIAFAQALSPISENIGWILVWQALWGLGFTLQSGADTAWITDEIGEADDPLIMRHAIMRSVGIIFGVALSIGLSQISLALTMVIGGACSLGFAVFLALVMPENNFTRADRPTDGRWAEFADVTTRGFAITRRKRALATLAMAMMMLSLADEAIDRLDLRRIIDLGLTDIDGPDAAVWFGLVWITMTVLNIPVMLVAERRIGDLDVAGLARTLRAVLVVSALGVAMMAWGAVFGLAIVGWIARDVIRELIEPISVAWTNRQAESDVRATVLSFQSQIVALGQVIGGLLLGTIAEVTSLPVAFWLAAAFTLGAAAIFGTATNRGREQRIAMSGNTDESP